MALKKDLTRLVPFALFVLFAGVIAFAIIKGSPKKLSKEEIEEIYKKTGNSTTS